MSRVIYFDNAATTWPKPKSVVGEVGRAMKNKGGNPGRGSHKLALAASDVVYECREALADMFGGSAENVVFTMNATQALNMAIKGLVRKESHILIDNLCHNASRRPVTALEEHGDCTFDFFDACLDEESLLEDIKSKLKPNTKMIIATHQCNISSDVIPIEIIGKFCAEHGIDFVVDASQSAGHLPINIEDMNITALCMPGHKGLYGPMGVGVLISAADAKYDTIIEGGAGINSLDGGMPDELPERLEAGTVPLPAIAGLFEGINYVNKTGVDEIHLYECMLADYFVDGIVNLPGIVLYGSSCGSNVSFNLEGYAPSEVGAYLSSKGICTRTGYHCAPCAHHTLGSYENGSVRVSFSYMNSISEVSSLINILYNM